MDDKLDLLDDIDTDVSETEEKTVSAPYLTPLKETATNTPPHKDANYVTREEFELVCAERDAAEAKAIQQAVNVQMLTEALEEMRKLYWALRGEPAGNGGI